MPCRDELQAQVNVFRCIRWLCWAPVCHHQQAGLNPSCSLLLAVAWVWLLCSYRVLVEAPPAALPEVPSLLALPCAQPLELCVFQHPEQGVLIQAGPRSCVCP